MANKIYRASILNNTMRCIFKAANDNAARIYAQTHFIEGGFKPYQLADLTVERYKYPKKTRANF